jgi:antirestriction protein ArdC
VTFIPYKGINVVMRWSASVTRGSVGTLELDGHVKKVESGELVVDANSTETDAKG